MARPAFSISFTEKFWSLEFCVVCRSPVSVTAKICHACLEALNFEYKTYPQRNQRFQTFSLYNWSFFSTSLDPLVYSLKGRRNKKLCEYFARNMIYSFADSSSEYCFVFVESSNYGINSHGFNLAKILGSYFRAPLVYMPFKQKDGPQKRKSLGERIKVLCKNSVYREFTESMSYVFVDDVVTSGATSQAVYRGLGSPEKYQVWSVFDRPNRDCSYS